MTTTLQPVRPHIPLRGGDTKKNRPLPKGVLGIGQLEQARGAARRESAPSGTLIVGRGIQIKGGIENCRTLVVEGRVEASLKAETLEVLKGGLFRGTAAVGEATIAGTFEGTLIVSKRLNIAPGGHAGGKIRYAQIAIEPGGVISGDVDAGTGADVGGAGEADEAEVPALSAMGS